MTTLGDAKMPTLRDKINAMEVKETVKEKTVKVKNGKGRGKIKV